MNSISFTGNLGQDPELRFTSSGKEVVSFSVADTCYVKGEYLTIWRRCTAFGGLAKRIHEHLDKGDAVVVFGREEPNNWTDKNGNEREDRQIIVNDCVFPKKSRATKDTQPDDDLPF